MTESPSALKKLCASLLREHVVGLQPQGSGALERIGTQVGAGDFFLPVDAVGIAGQGMDAPMSLERDRQGEQIFHIAAAPAVAAHGHRGFTAR